MLPVLPIAVAARTVVVSWRLIWIKDASLVAE